MRIFSEEHRRRISEAAKGRVFTPEHLEKLRIVNTGRKHSEETKEKIRIGNVGKTMSPESRSKMSASQKGKKHSIESRLKQSATIKGVGKSPEHIAKIVAGRKRYYDSHPKEHAEQKSILSRYQASLTPEQRYTRSNAGRLACMSAMKNRKRTSIENAVGAELDRLEVEYIEQLEMGYYSVDFYIPKYNSVIECDGDYWHSTAKVKARDARKDLYLRSRGARVYRITETNIKKDVKFFVGAVMAEMLNVD